MTMEWTISVEGTNEFGDTSHRESRIDKSDERLRGGHLGLSIDDGKKIMATLQAAVVQQVSMVVLPPLSVATNGTSNASGPPTR